MPDKGFRTIIAELVAGNPDADHEDLALLALDRIGVVGEPAEMLAPLVTDEVRRIRRDGARAAEHEAFTRRKGGAGMVESFGEERFALPDGRIVGWLDATVADHESRIEMLEKLRNGLNRTIERHREAADVCRKAGVDCLRKLTKQAAKRGAA